MKPDQPVRDYVSVAEEAPHSGDLQPLLNKTIATASGAGVSIGDLIALDKNSGTAFVVFPGQTGTAAVAARSAIDLHIAQVGRQVVLVFESADVNKPIVIGVLRAGFEANDASPVGRVEVEADGTRVVFAAKQQLVLTCGEASITLTQEGKILTRGTYVSSHSTGVNRLKGGSVQIN